MKTSQHRHLKASVLVLSSLSALATAQQVPGSAQVVPAQQNIQATPLGADVKVPKKLNVIGPYPQQWQVPKFTYQINVKENQPLPKPPPGCEWKAPVYSPANGSGTVLSGDVIDVKVTNELVCGPVDPYCAATQVRTTLTLGPASIWKDAAGAPRATIASAVGGWAYAQPGADWVGQNTNPASTGVPWNSEIPFCMCPGSTAKADVNNFRVDNSGKLYFDAPFPATNVVIVAPASPPSFSPGPNALSGSQSITATMVSPHSQHKLVMATEDIGAQYSGFTMLGTLVLSKGYFGKCKTATGGGGSQTQ